MESIRNQHLDSLNLGLEGLEMEISIFGPSCGQWGRREGMNFLRYYQGKINNGEAHCSD